MRAFNSSTAAVPAAHHHPAVGSSDDLGDPAESDAADCRPRQLQLHLHRRWGYIDDDDDADDDDEFERFRARSYSGGGFSPATRRRCRDRVAAAQRAGLLPLPAGDDCGGGTAAVTTPLDDHRPAGRHRHATLDVVTGDRLMQMKRKQQLAKFVDSAPVVGSVLKPIPLRPGVLHGPATAPTTTVK